MSSEVTLSFFELWQAAGVGVLRNLEVRRHGRPDTYGKRVELLEGGWGMHIEGAAAEMALAKHLGRYWEGVWRAIDRSRGDVAEYQVRSTMRSDGSLLLHREDADDALFVLLVGMAPTFTVVGCIRGRDGKQERFWREDTGRPAYFVPQSALRKQLA